MFKPHTHSNAGFQNKYGAREIGPAGPAGEEFGKKMKRNLKFNDLRAASCHQFLSPRFLNVTKMYFIQHRQLPELRNVTQLQTLIPFLPFSFLFFSSFLFFTRQREFCPTHLSTFLAAPAVMCHPLHFRTCRHHLFMCFLNSVRVRVQSPLLLLPPPLHPPYACGGGCYSLLVEHRSLS